MRVAIGQTVGIPGNIPANLDIMVELAAEAARQEARLLVMPELFLSGYNIGGAVAALAEPASGPSIMAAGEIARTHGIALAFGYPERAPEGIYNAAILINRHGEVRANYRKSHLWGDAERRDFLLGDAPAIFEMDGMHAAFMICYDLDFPEVARKLALDGVDAIISISATTDPYHVVPRSLIPARAYENRVFVLFANRTGSEHGLEYVGESCLAAPDGSFLVQGGTDEGLLIGEIDLGRYAPFRRDHDYRADRRAELYG